MAGWTRCRARRCGRGYRCILRPCNSRVAAGAGLTARIGWIRQRRRGAASGSSTSASALRQSPAGRLVQPAAGRLQSSALRVGRAISPVWIPLMCRSLRLNFHCGRRAVARPGQVIFSQAPVCLISNMLRYVASVGDRCIFSSFSSSRD